MGHLSVLRLAAIMTPKYRQLTGCLCRHNRQGTHSNLAESWASHHTLHTVALTFHSGLTIRRSKHTYSSLQYALFTTSSADPNDGMTRMATSEAVVFCFPSVVSSTGSNHLHPVVPNPSANAKDAEEEMRDMMSAQDKAMICKKQLAPDVVCAGNRKQRSPVCTAQPFAALSREDRRLHRPCQKRNTAADRPTGRPADRPTGRPADRPTEEMIQVAQRAHAKRVSHDTYIACAQLD
jgi:hypothetical protein